MKRIMGVDEAGRGPVLGPMVLCAVAIPSRARSEFESIGLRDSKKLTRSARTEKEEKIRHSEAEVHEEVIPARKIDNHSLTEISRRNIAGIIDRVQPDHVVIDAPGHPKILDRFTRNLNDNLSPGTSPEIVVEPGADDNYPVVSAASIVAKVKRDQVIHELAEEHGDIGSGYPSDRTTRQYLRQLLESGGPVHSFIRTRWKTFQDLLAEQGGPLYADLSTNEESDNDR